MVMLKYWWIGLYEDVRQIVRNCASCRRVEDPVFKSHRPELQSLPISGMFYTWHVDLCGPFEQSWRGNRYVL